MTYDPVGRCIYCGLDGEEGGLGDEHMVPFALGGTLILPKASCRRCEGITSAFEGRCARTMYGTFRIRMGVPTRRPKDRPTHLPSTAHWEDGTTASVLLPINGIIANLPLVQFLPPGYMRTPPVKEIGWVGAELSAHTIGPLSMDSWEHQSYSLEQKYDLDCLALTLAKISHVLCVAEFGFETFDHWLPPYILGYDKNLSYLIGGASESGEPRNVLHDLKFEVCQQGDGNFMIFVKARLFAQFGGPTALIVVGPTTQERLDARDPKFRKFG